ncbi:MAG: hypothetical protein P4L51_15235 [Puia sp.]|nr:hypothetical protein [Puia sp.]
MDTKNRHIHRGKILEETARRSELSVTQIAKKARFSRGSFYNHTNDPDLPFEILERYGAVLKHDFTAEIPKMPRYDLEVNIANRPVPANFGEALVDRDFWRDKYMAVMEDYKKIMERYNRLLEANARKD